MEQAGKVSLVSLVRSEQVYHLRHALSHSKEYIDQADLNQALHEAARRGHLHATEALIAAGADIHTVDNCGQNIMLQAIVGGNKDIVQMLLDRGFPVSPRDAAKLCVALQPDEPAVNGIVNGHAPEGEETESVKTNGVKPEESTNEADVAAKSEGGDARVAETDAKQEEKSEKSVEADEEKDSKQKDSEESVGADEEKDPKKKDSEESVEHENKSASPLHMAVKCSNTDMVNLLINAGVDVDAKDGDGDTPLIASIVDGNCEIAEILISNDCDVDLQGFQQNTAIVRAAEFNHPTIIKLLMNAGADPNIANSHGDGALLVAIRQNYTECAKLLIHGEADLHKVNDVGEGVALKAALAHNIEVMKLLIENGADVNVKAKNEYTALIRAAETKHIEMIELLLNHGADPNVKGPAGMTPLHWCAYYGLEDCVKLFCANEKVDLNVTNAIPATPVIMSARMGNIPCINAFLRRDDLDVNLATLGGRTILHWIAAISSTPDETLDLLFSKSPNLDARDCNGDTALILASAVKNIAFIRRLLALGVDVNAQGVKKRSALHWMAEFGDVDIVGLLSDAGADPNLTDADGSTPLLHAAKAQDVMTLRILLAQKADEITDPESSQENLDKVKSKYAEVIEKLLAKGASPIIADADGIMPLHLAAYSGLRSSVNLLIKSGAEVNHVNSNGSSAVLAAASAGHADIVMDLLQNGANVTHMNQQGHTTLYCAAKHGQTDLVKTLIEHGVDANQGTEEEFPLKAATQAGHTEIVGLLIEAGCDLLRKDASGRCCMHWAASEGHFSILDLLVSQGIDPKCRDDTSDTPLTLAAWNKNAEVLKFLIPLSDVSHTENDEGMAALHLAVVNDFEEGVQLLIEGGAQVAQVDKNGNNSIVLGCMHKTSVATLTRLLESGQEYDINAVGVKTRTALHWAVDDVESVKALLKHGANADAIDKNTAAVLQLAIAHKQEEVAVELIKHGCDVNVPFKDGSQCIHHACIYGQSLVVEALLQKGVDVNLPSTDEKTPILLAAIEGNANVIEVLIKHGARVNDIFYDLVTPLSVATAGRRHRTMQVLLDGGADPNLIGPEKQPPLITSIMRGDVQSLFMLMQANAEIDDAKEGQMHPIQVAAVKKFVFILVTLASFMCNVNYIRQFLTEGAVYYFIENDKTTAFLRACSESPKTLQMLCRRQVRNSLGFPISRKVEALNAKQEIKDYISMKEIWKLAPEELEDDM